MTVPNPGSGQELTMPIDTVVGRVGGLLHRRGALQSTFNGAFAGVLRGRAAASVAITPGLPQRRASGDDGSESGRRAPEPLVGVAGPRPPALAGGSAAGFYTLSGVSSGVCAPTSRSTTT